FLQACPREFHVLGRKVDRGECSIWSDDGGDEWQKAAAAAAGVKDMPARFKPHHLNDLGVLGSVHLEVEVDIVRTGQVVAGRGGVVGLRHLDSLLSLAVSALTLRPGRQ